MLFQVIKNGEIKMQTNSEEFIPPTSLLLEMKKAGYTFKLNDKKYVPKANQK